MIVIATMMLPICRTFICSPPYQEGGVPQTIAQWRYSGKVVQLAFIFRVGRTVCETAFIAASAASRFT